ncbi:hypothetical protein B0I37DRAFT_417732 [Chaetomium sp. MPI-CAGE-AT-0009]|nr:hypothetical protein B0I37DRAFT_417732 [Chaetomium sp. MPI-CAGE-AT-0009]
MKFFLLPLAVMASSAMAQTTAAACGADYIVEACLGSEEAKLANCKTEEWDCLCAQWESILTCYNNCPNDSRQPTAAGQRDIFCGYASQFAPKPTQVPTQTASNPQTTQNSASQGGSTEATATTSSSGPADTNSAASLALNAGGVLAAVAGVFAVVL